ncbi:hypothetical protein TsFJ059_010239, partial [Trichoderma semiorbis]
DDPFPPRSSSSRFHFAKMAFFDRMSRIVTPARMGMGRSIADIVVAIFIRAAPS